MPNMFEYNNQSSAEDLVEIIIKQKEVIKELKTKNEAINNDFVFPESGIANAPYSYFKLDKNGHCKYVNKKWEAIHCITRETVIDTPYTDTFPPYLKDEFNSYFTRVMSGEKISTEIATLNKNKTIRYNRYQLCPVYKYDDIIGIEGFIDEITPLKNAEEELDAYREKYKIISENIPVIVYSALPDIDSTNLFLSGSITELTGYSKDDFFNDPKLWKSIIYTDDRKLVEASLEKHRITKSKLNIEYRIITKSGDVKWIRDIASPFTNADGEIQRISGFMEDISERKNAERALVISEKKFRSLFDESQDCIYISSKNGQIIDINPAGLKLLGYKKQQMMTQNVTSLYVNIADRLRLKRILEKEGFVKNFGVRLQKNNGSIINCLLSSNVRKNEQGKTIGYQGIIRDVTAEKQSELVLLKAKEQAEKADRMKTEFLAQMSHEIRTPINTILSFTSLINEETDVSNNPIMEEYFNILNRAGKRIIRTIDLILNMAEIQTGSFCPKLSNIDLPGILADLYAEYKTIAAEKKLELLMDFEKSSLNIYADEYSVTQILSNLLDNAIKYTNTGHISVCFAEKENTVELSVSDTGIGMAKKYLANVFDSFTQEEQGYTRKYEGSGLGLALVKKYCEFNNASISVESKKGKGTKFSITFRKAD